MSFYEIMEVSIEMGNPIHDKKHKEIENNQKTTREHTPEHDKEMTNNSNSGNSGGKGGNQYTKTWRVEVPTPLHNRVMNTYRERGFMTKAGLFRHLLRMWLREHEKTNKEPKTRLKNEW